MTNRDLAERIVQAVMDADHVDGDKGWPRCVDAVLDVLAETGHAFVRLVDDDEHPTFFRLMDERQEDLFRAKP